MRQNAAAAALLALLAGPAAAGDLRGVVHYRGAPRAAALEVTKDQAACGTTVPDESLLVAGGRLKNAVVTVKGAPPPPPGRATLDQRGCRYVPHVQAVAAGSTLEILNGDPILHNVHGWTGKATAFNVAMPLRDQKVPRRLDRPGLIRVGCDVHAWMGAWILVADAPFAVSGDDGRFAISGLPPGRYSVTAWHERLGEKTAEVTVPAQGEVSLDFGFGG